MLQKLTVTTTYLQMLRRPEPNHSAPPRDGLTVVHALSPTVSYYRYLYNTVGADWLWTDRRGLTDEELRTIVQDPAVEIYVLCLDGVPAGYAELDLRNPPDIELAYFGIMPEFIGQGMGTYLLAWTISTAWNREPEPARLWVHTCSLDHPRALATYLRAGFLAYETKIEIRDDPRSLRLL